MKFQQRIIAMILCASTAAIAQTDTTFTYQGSLQQSGLPANGSYNIDFTLWDAVSGGTQIGSSVMLNAHAVSDGLLTAHLDFGVNAFDNSPRWLEISIGGTELSPRQAISRAPYAIQTRGINVSGVGKVGIGTTNPQTTLHVVGSDTANHVIFGVNTASVGNKAGVYGQTNSTSGIGVSGYASTTSGFNYGVFGESNSITGTGVYGRASQGVGGSFGVVGQSSSQSGTGVYGFASSNSGNTRAIHGESTSPTGFAGYFTGRGYFSKSVGFGVGSPSYPVHALNNGTNGIAIYGEGFWGVQGTSIQPEGRGVFGFDANNTGASHGVFGLTASSSGTGVYGYAPSSNGATVGVHGQSDSSIGRGVYGEARSTTGGAASGVYGKSASNAGSGVAGIATSLVGLTYGVEGTSYSSDGIGVIGRNESLTGSAWGVYGRSESESGRGVYGSVSGTSGIAVYGYSAATTGGTVGVYGKCDSPNGYAFFANSAGVNYGSLSSIRYKRNVRRIDDALGKLAQIRGVYYDWDAEHGGGHDIGMIAEEVGAVLPEIVNYEENGTDAIGMDYSRTTPLLVEAVNALRAEKDAEIDALRAEKNAEVAALHNRIAALERMVMQMADTNEEKKMQR